MVYVLEFYHRSTLICPTSGNPFCEYGSKRQKARGAYPSSYSFTSTLPPFRASSTLPHRKRIPAFKSLLPCREFNWRAHSIFCKWKNLLAFGQKAHIYFFKLIYLFYWGSNLGPSLCWASALLSLSSIPNTRSLSIQSLLLE